MEKEQVKSRELTVRLETVLIDDAVATKAVEKGIRPTAILDVKARARSVFKLDSDKVVAMKDGKPAFDAKGEPLSIAAWLDALATEAPHLFEANKGGGGGNDKDKGIPGGGVNPYSKATWNLTSQAKVERENAPLAKRLKEAAVA